MTRAMSLGQMNIIFPGKSGNLVTSCPYERPESDQYKICFYDFSLNPQFSYALNTVEYKDKQNLEFRQPQLDWEEPELDDFKQDVDYLQKCFEAGMAKKAVPICFSEAKGELNSEELLYLEKQFVEQSRQSQLYSIFVDSPQFKYIGMSPEILFERRGAVVSTMALAGTRALDENFSEEEFLKDPKEKREHQIVIDSIVEDLSPLGELTVSQTYVHKLKHLAHLRTDIQITLEQEITNRELVSLLHPTPALGVYPRNSLQDWFALHNQNKKRSLFGAPILIESEDWARCIVGIRSLFFEEGRWRLGSGCGVVSESRWEPEWKELQNKRKSVLGRLGLD